MTTNIVQSISDEHLAELESRCCEMRSNGGAILMSEEWLSGLIARLRAAEVDAKRYRWIFDTCEVSHYEHGIFESQAQLDEAMELDK